MERCRDYAGTVDPADESTDVTGQQSQSNRHKFNR